MSGGAAPEVETFGVHIMLDGYDADGPLMRDEGALAKLLQALPLEMGMHAICAPVVVAVGPNCAKDPGGLSGFVMIAESHISFHTFPARRFVTMDLYTCRTGTDVPAVVARLSAAFGLSDVEVHVQRRGLRYPAADLAAWPVAATRCGGQGGRMTHRLSLRVYYEDTDLAGIVYYANYLRFIERARTEWVRTLGIDQVALREEQGIVFAVRRVEADYLRPARFDDVIEVRTVLQGATGARIALAQDIWRGPEQLFAGTVTLVALTGAGTPARLPATLRARLSAV